MMWKERLRKPPTWTLALRSERSVPKEQSKGGVRAREVYGTEQSARPSRKPWRSQQMPKWFGMEAFFFGNRPRLTVTE